MPSSAVNICVLTLVLLSFQQICHSRPHSRSKRGLVKDYFVPDTLIFSSDKFEKGEDGKYYLKKSAHKSDSEVKYTSAENAEDGNNILQDDMKSDDVEIVKYSLDNVQTESSTQEPLKEEVTEKVVTKVVPTPPVIDEMKVKEVLNSPKTQSIVEETAKIIESNEKAPFTPVEPKFTMPPKPDSKDEIPMKTDLPPIDVEEKVDEKIAIGQVPDLYSRLVPIPGTFRVPVLIPIRQVSYGSVKVVPLPPADVSDRLPLPYEDDIIGEGAHESESEEVSEPITEKKDSGYPFINPLAMGIHLPGLSFRNILKDLKEVDKKDVEKQSKVVDVLGKKFLMQSNVMKYPTGENSNMFIRFLSVKPLEEIKPVVPTEVVAEEALEKSLNEAKRTDMKEPEEKKEEFLAKEKEIAKKEESVIESEMTKAEEELLKEQEILKVEETQIKMNVDQDVPKEVILENMGKPQVKIEDSEVKEMKPVEDEIKMHEMEHSVIINEELTPVVKTEETVITSLEKTKPVVKTEETIMTLEKTEPVVKTEETIMTSLEKAESQVVEKKVESEVEKSKIEEKMDEESIEDDKDISEEVRDEKKIETVDALLKKKEAEKEMELASKKDFFLVEKKKKTKFVEENEEVKHKKKSEKKKKKCKCEEKDSDSDDDE